jgi:presenilin-like A22 family membrane protease
MVIAPGEFYVLVGPFGERNDHYTRDNATFGLALGAAALIAIRLKSWRLPVLVVLALQFSLHAVNHLVDINAAHPEILGPIDFGLITLGAVLAALLARRARREQREA